MACLYMYHECHKHKKCKLMYDTTMSFHINTMTGIVHHRLKAYYENNRTISQKTLTTYTKIYIHVLEAQNEHYLFRIYSYTTRAL